MNVHGKCKGILGGGGGGGGACVCVCVSCADYMLAVCSFDWSTIHTLLFFGRFCGMLSFQILPCICLNTQLRVRAMSPIYLLYVISDIYPKKMEAMQQMCRRS